MKERERKEERSAFLMVFFFGCLPLQKKRYKYDNLKIAILQNTEHQGKEKP